LRIFDLGLIPRINPGACTTFEILGQKTDLGLMLINPLSRINKRFDREVWAQKPGISPPRNRRAIAKNEKSPIHPSSCLDLLE
jgi:hypothetical protein